MSNEKDNHPENSIGDTEIPSINLDLENTVTIDSESLLDSILGNEETKPTLSIRRPVNLSLVTKSEPIPVPAPVAHGISRKSKKNAAQYTAVLKTIKEQFEKDSSTSSLKGLILVHADELVGISGDQFVRSLDLISGYKTILSQTMSLYRWLTAHDYQVIHHDPEEQEELDLDDQMKKDHQGLPDNL